MKTYISAIAHTHVQPTTLFCFINCLSGDISIVCVWYSVTQSAFCVDFLMLLHIYFWCVYTVTTGLGLSWKCKKVQPRHTSQVKLALSFQPFSLYIMRFHRDSTGVEFKGYKRHLGQATCYCWCALRLHLVHMYCSRYT